jgi:hypothetical protein
MFDWLRNRFRRKSNEPVKPNTEPAKVDTIAYEAVVQRSILRIEWFVKHWPEQKLHDVYAFCQDGRMDFYNPCRCLLGVFGSKTLHECCILDGTPDHYLVLWSIPGMAEIERAYQILGLDTVGGFSQKLRDKRLLDILAIEMPRRARIEWSADLNQEIPARAPRLGEGKPIGAL